MSRRHHAELGPTVLGSVLAIAVDHGQAVPESGWAGGNPPLPEALLWASVGDLDVIERLRKHIHQVRMPDWFCSSCGLAWPCANARDELLLDLGWGKVAIYCAVLMERAVRDLAAINPHILWQRFIEWTDPPEEARAAMFEQFA